MNPTHCRHRVLPAGLVFLLALTLPGAAPAEVVDASAQGFTSRHEVQVPASPDETYARLVGEVDRWWNGAHSFSADAANLRIDAEPGGCLLETLPGAEGEGDGWVCHLRVVHANPGKLLRFAGGLGPLQGLGVNGALSWELAPEGEGTKVTVTYAVGGYLDGGLEGWSGPVDGVIGEQVQRFATYVRTGSPVVEAESD